MQIAKLPRVRLANLPTPLQEMPNLSKRLGGPRIFVKRDDLTGVAFGGNKTRKLEFLMGDAQRNKADVIVVGVQGFQSNHLTQAAAFARKLGMDVVLVKTGPKDDYEPEEYDGNHLLQFILGADIRVYEHAPKLEDVAEELEKKGYTPYIISLAGSTPIGTVGYLNASLEILSQTTEMEIKVDYIVHATGGGGTQAGLILGARALNTSTKVLGISVFESERTESMTGFVSKLVNDTAQLLDVDLSIGKRDITIIDGYSEGYGIINNGKVEAIKLVAQTEGIFLDPVYTGTAMAGLIDLIRKGYFDKDDNVVFIHTGGNAALFPYKEPIKSIMKSEEPRWTKPHWGRAQLRPGYVVFVPPNAMHHFRNNGKQRARKQSLRFLCFFPYS